MGWLKKLLCKPEPKPEPTKPDPISAELERRLMVIQDDNGE